MAQKKVSVRQVEADTDVTLAANSDLVVPTQKAVKAYADTKQTSDSDLTTIAGLTATTDNFMVATASAWASRTPSQARTQMGLGTIATQAAPSGTVVGTTDTQTLTNKTLTTPTISATGFTNANHAHAAANSGGTLDAAAIAAGTLGTARLGSGTADSTALLSGASTWLKRSMVLLSEQGATVSNTTTLTSVYTSAYTLAAGEVGIGDVIVVEHGGAFLNNSGANSTLQFKFFFGTNSGLNFTSGAIATQTVANTHFVFRAVCRINSNTNVRCVQTLFGGGAGGSTALVAANSSLVNSTITIANVTSATNTIDLQVAMGNSGTATQTYGPTSGANIILKNPDA